MEKTESKIRKAFIDLAGTIIFTFLVGLIVWAVLRGLGLGANYLVCVGGFYIANRIFGR